LTHAGIYAEATLIIRDEEQSDEGQPHKCYIFCEQGNSDRLFEEIDKKTSVPLIPAFRDYVLSELQNRGILQPLKVVSYREKFDAWALTLTKNDANIAEVLNDGLRSGAITIPGTADNEFPAVHTVTQYLNTFGVQIAERIKSQFEPLFDPATETLSPEILAVNAYIRRNAGYSLYDAQLAVAESLKRGLKANKSALLIAECGSGKTKIGATALHAYQSHNDPRKNFNIILCPSHMTKKWVREIEESIPNTFAVVVKSITELNQVYDAYERGDKSCYIMMSKEKARDGYMKRPAAVWSRHRKAFICPDCYEPIEMELTSDGSKYKIPADQFFFRRENKQNHKCSSCGSILWTVLVPEQQSEWVKVSDLGFVHRWFAHEHLPRLEKKPALYDAVKAIADNPDGYYPNSGVYKRFALSTYIKKHMRRKISGLIVDELHQYNNASGQGDAMAELFGAAKKVIGLTATLINGYSSGIFHLLYRVSPGLMLKDDKLYDKPAIFDDEYGVTEAVYEIDAPDYNSNRRTAKKKIREKQLPGVSPLVYSRFLMETVPNIVLMKANKNKKRYLSCTLQNGNLCRKALHKSPLFRVKQQCLFFLFRFFCFFLFPAVLKPKRRPARKGSQAAPEPDPSPCSAASISAVSFRLLYCLRL
jgi:hypothetical protein